MHTTRESLRQAPRARGQPNPFKASQVFSHVWTRCLLAGTAALMLFIACTRRTSVDLIETATPAPPYAVTLTLPPAAAGHSRAVTPPAALPTAVQSPTPAFTLGCIGTPTPNPTPAGWEGTSASSSYTVRSGDTLSSIAATYGCSVDDLLRVNGLSNADVLSAGQTLAIPLAADRSGPDLKLIPDSEMVYGPAYVHFDLAGYVAAQGGYLSTYTDDLDGELLTGAEIVEAVARRFSVGPRTLLALLELQSGWVTQPAPAESTLVYPLGSVEGGLEGLSQQLSRAAVELNAGYYGWKWGTRSTIQTADGVRVFIAPNLNPGTAGVQNFLSTVAGWEEWLVLTAPEGFALTYERLFGSPFAYAVEPVLPPNLTQPELRLPWAEGATWYLSGGPHEGWGRGSPWAAVDFVTAEQGLGCWPSEDWVRAAAPGVILYSHNGEVLQDLDGDGFAQSGWVLLYMHIYSEDRVPAGVYLPAGARVGHPSCQGGYSEASHLHFARRYNGEWIPAGSGPLPLVLSGWTARDGWAAYEGSFVRGDETREACECWIDAVNGFISDNPPVD